MPKWWQIGTIGASGLAPCCRTGTGRSGRSDASPAALAIEGTPFDQRRCVFERRWRVGQHGHRFLQCLQPVFSAPRQPDHAKRHAESTPPTEALNIAQLRLGERASSPCIPKGEQSLSCA
jgi:hypothetical protein